MKQLDEKEKQSNIPFQQMNPKKEDRTIKTTIIVITFIIAVITSKKKSKSCDCDSNFVKPL